MWILIFVGLLVLAAFFYAGFLPSFLIFGTLAGLLTTYFVMSKKNRSGPNVLTLGKIILGASVVSGIIGVPMFLIGLFTAEDSYSVQQCAWCGGFTGCSLCEGYGLQIVDDPIFSPITWLVILFAAAGVIGFLGTLIINDDILK